MVKEVKGNKKGLYGYVSKKRKTKASVRPVPNGEPDDTEMGKKM